MYRMLQENHGYTRENMPQSKNTTGLSCKTHGSGKSRHDHPNIPSSNNTHTQALDDASITHKIPKYKT